MRKFCFRNNCFSIKKKSRNAKFYQQHSMDERMDQYIYIEECKKEKTEIPDYLTEQSLEMLNQFQNVEEIFQCINNKNIKMALVARYQYYLWLKKKFTSNHWRCYNR